MFAGIFTVLEESPGLVEFVRVKEGAFIGYGLTTVKCFSNTLPPNLPSISFNLVVVVHKFAKEEDVVYLPALPLFIFIFI